MRILQSTLLGSFIVITAVSAFMFAGEAAETKYSNISCWAGESKTIVHTKTHIAFNSVFRDTLRPYPVNAKDDVDSYECVGVAAIISGKYTHSGYCDGKDKDGSKWFGSFTSNGAQGQWTFISGTGKWKGVQGGGTNQTLGQTPQLRPGTFQGCNLGKGTYTTP